MSKNKQLRSRVLFVCLGNTCRSPMAEGITQNMAKERIYVESAGIAKTGENAAIEAIEVMKGEFNVDISAHRPRNVANVSLNDFDYIIAMERGVYNHLKQSYQILPGKLKLLDIEDPFGRGIEAYKKCARKIRSQVIDLLIDLELTTSGCRTKQR